MTMTSTFRRNRQRVSDPDGSIVLLEISHSSFTAPFRLANDTQAWTSQGVTYIGYPFRFTLPDSGQSESPKMALEMDNIGKDILTELEQITEPGEELWCKVMLADRSQPDVHVMTFRMPISQISVDGATISAQPSMDALLNRSVVMLRYDKRTAPGIFQ